MYADDVVLTLLDIKMSLPPFLDLIEKSGQLSGFTITWDKSVFMPLTYGLDSGSLDCLSFRTPTDHCKYLGIDICRNPQLAFKVHDSVMTDKLKTMIDKWKLLPISLIGRINSIKMEVLPKICPYIPKCSHFPYSLFFFSREIPSSFLLSGPTSLLPFPEHICRNPRVTVACNVRAWVFWN